MNRYPHFSVIIPNYNNGDTLKRAVDSVLSQSFPAYEIIIIDDGSTDHSSVVATEFGRSIIYQYQQNAGVSAARNLGALIATGDWLAFLDADDTFFPDRLEAHAKWLADEPDLDFLLGNQEHLTPEGVVLMRSLEGCMAGKSLLARNPGINKIQITQSDFEDLIADGFGEIRTLSVPRRVFNELQGFRVGMRIGEDMHFLIRLCARSRKAGVITSVLAAYYIYPTSALRQDVVEAQRGLVNSLEALAIELANSPSPICIGIKKKIRNARLSLAYAYLRENKKAKAIGSVLPTLLISLNVQSLRDVLSIVKGMPKPKMH